VLPPDYKDVNISTKVVKIIQSYTKSSTKRVAERGVVPCRMRCAKAWMASSVFW
jgi:hypothetical protein